MTLKSSGSILTFVLCFLIFKTVSAIEIYGTVVDWETKEPIKGALVSAYMPNQMSLGSTSTDSLGEFQLPLIKENTPIKNIYCDISAKDYYGVHISIDSSRLVRDCNLDTIKLGFLSVRWPVSDSIKNLPKLWEPALDTIPYPSPIYRTVRPPCMPDLCYARAQSPSGGEWVLFNFGYEFAPLFITYRYPDGRMENSCPTGYRWNGVKMYVDKEGVTLASQDEGTMPSSRFTLRDLKTDSDSDGLPDHYEEYCGLNPRYGDTDGDGVDDLNDPLPLVKKGANNDTTEVLQKCYVPDGYFNKFGVNDLNAVVPALPDSVAVWVTELWHKMPGYDARYGSRYTELEKLLITMSPAQLRALYPHLKKLSMKVPPTQYANGRMLVFPYLELLRDARNDNLDRIRREIMKTYFMYFISLEFLSGDLERLGLHPQFTDMMYITGENNKYLRPNILRFRGRLSASIKKIDENAALIVFDCTVFGEEQLYIKRNGDWVKVWKQLTWIS